MYISGSNRSIKKTQEYNILNYCSKKSIKHNKLQSGLSSLISFIIMHYMYAVILMQTQDAHHNLVMNYLNYVDATLYL